MLDSCWIRYDMEYSNMFKCSENVILHNLLWSGAYKPAVKMAPIVVNLTLSHQWWMGFITEQGHPSSKLQAHSLYYLQYIVL